MKTSSSALAWQLLERLVVLVDVQVFSQGNVDAAQAYADLIHSSTERILAVCNDHNTGHKRRPSWSYKLFDSSLSPSVSKSTLQRLLNNQSGGQLGRFNSAEESLGLFQQTLRTVATDVNSKCDPGQTSQAKADFVVRALQELLADFNWNSVFVNDESSSDADQAGGRGDSTGGSPFISQENLVIVFSHLPDNLEHFARFLNMSTQSRDSELLKAFSSKLKRLQEPFRLQGICSCWIDMPHVSTSLTNLPRRPTAFTESYRQHQRLELRAIFARMKWRFSTMDALAVAFDCIPPPIFWFSVVHPGLQVQPNAQRMQCKLRIRVRGRDGKDHEPDVVRLEAVSFGSNVVESVLMKEKISAMLNLGSLSSNAEKLALVSCPPSVPPSVKIVVKSLLQKQDVSFKCSFRYLLCHRADPKKRDSLPLEELKLDSLSDCVASDVNGHDILQQLQQEPMSFEPGDCAWQVLLLAIARKNSVAEVELNVDGDRSLAILEPISLKYAALLQECQSSQSLSPDCQKHFRVPQTGPKALVVASSLQPILKSDEDALLEGSERARMKNGPKSLVVSSLLQPALTSREDAIREASGKQGARSKRRRAPSISVLDAALVKRVNTEYGRKQKPTCAEEIKHTRRETYSWIEHWKYILYRKTVGTGKVQVENRYMRPGSGKKPSKAISIIKCWLDLLSKPKPLTALQIVPFSLPAPGPAEPDAGALLLEGGHCHLGSAERVGQADYSVLPLRGKSPFSVISDTEEQAESYLSSIEQKVQDCLHSDDGDLQVFAKGIISNATGALRILLRREIPSHLARSSDEDMQCLFKGDTTQVLSNAQNTIEKKKSLESCNSDSSCASNQSKAGKVDLKETVTQPMKQEAFGAVTGVKLPTELGRFSAAADAGGQTNEAVLSEMVAGQLACTVLVKPKKLARNYSNCESASSDFVHIRLQKLRAYELQILVRMELIEVDCGGPLEKKRKKIVRDICTLLDDIQFDLGGGVFGGESVLDYSIRVIYNRYKERLPQTVADIFEGMEFNGYVEGVSEVLPGPDLPHADSVQRETDSGVFKGNFTDATGSFVPVEQASEETGENGAIPTSKKGRKRTKRKRPVPIDPHIRASEKRKLASRLAHFGGPDSLHRLKKIKVHHQSPRLSNVSSPTIDKFQRRGRHVVLETPRFERRKVIGDSPPIVHEDDEAESTCTRALPQAFGFRSPARVSKPMPTTRGRPQELFREKKPPWRE